MEFGISISCLHCVVSLQNVDKAKFSIYIHSEPGFLFDESTTRSALFFNRQLGNSIKVTHHIIHCPLRRGIWI